MKRSFGPAETIKSIELRLEVEAVHTFRIEASAVARLYGEDPAVVVGWLYVWNTQELAIRCSDESIVFRFVDPPIDLDRYSPRFQANKSVHARLASTRPLPSQTA
ncbi:MULTISPECIES: hypothetical protein [unclassified Roseobacter]|uniref:Uncharacterized protein n=1 Tax=Roseobacter sinensis TaxID=2931391 RepID=A0ABT3BI25_9RHOB|nr:MULTISPECIES: hypothetical protein [unclassified Roseobacter]MCV3273223.1 hypothetical protein [Roseobacter sp. WL0113]